MALPVVIPNTFANANASIPLSQLDNNFSTVAVAINGMANGAEALSNVNITGGSIANASLSNVSISSGNVTINVANVTTLDATNVEVTNIKAKDGTASATIADSTGVMTIGSSVLTTTDINGGTVDNTSIGATTPSTGAFTTLSATGAISGTNADNNIVLSQNGSTQWRINNSNAGTAAAANLLLQNGTAVAGVYLFGTGYTTNGVLKANSASLYNNNSAGVSIAADNASGVITFASGGLTERARITSSGVFYLGPQATNFSFTNGSAVDLSGSGTGLAGNGTNLTLGVWSGPIVFQAGNSGGALVERARIDSSGNVGIGTSSPTAKLDVSSDVIRLRTSKTPASASATGNAGDIAWDSSYIYVCVATNTWKRVAIATW